MRTLSLVSVFLVIPSAALAADGWGSDPQPVQYADVHNILSTITFDTGYWPPSSPVAARFHVTPTGGVVSDVHGTSYLEWQGGRDAAAQMEHTVVGEPGGWFGVDTSVEIAAEVEYDVFGYSGTYNLWGHQFDLLRGVDLDTLLLANGHESASVSIEDRSLINPFAYNVQVVPGVVDLVLVVEFFPELNAELAGLSLDTDFPVGDSSIQFEGEWVGLPAPNDSRPGLLGLSEYSAHVKAVFDFIIEPSIRIDTPAGGFTVAQFPIPVELVDRSEVRNFDAVVIDHPLPVLSALPGAYDFGEVPVGGRANWELMLDNLGHLNLEGEAWIEGGGGYSVWPDFVHATPALGDGLVVSWAPESVGKEEAWLILQTSDPARPEVRVLLSGVGTGSVGGSDSHDRQMESTHLRTSSCGCASSTGGALSAAWLLLPLLYLRRRSTNFTRR